MKEYNINEIHIALAEQLLLCIKNNREQALIAYKDMCIRAGNIIDPRSSDGYIGDLSLICY